MNDSYPPVILYDLAKYHNFKYNLKNIPCFDSGIFLINEINRAEAETDILLLTDIFIAAHKNEPLFPVTRIYTDDIRFDASDALDPNQFCHFEIFDKTDEDNTDYILIMHFYVTPDPRNIIYGDIYYLSDGTVGKYNTVFEHENDIFIINCKKHGNRLEIQRVVYDKGKRKKRFYPYFKISMRAAYFISGVLLIMTVSLLITAFYIYDNIKLKNESVTVIKPESADILSVPELQTQTETYKDTSEILKPEISEKIDTIITESITVPQTGTTAPETVIQDEKPNNIAGLKLISITSPITQGNTAVLKIRGYPDTVYSIAVYYSSGISSASGLQDKVSDGSGYAEWSWKIGSRTKTGSFKITVIGGNETFTTEIIIT